MDSDVVYSTETACPCCGSAERIGLQSGSVYCYDCMFDLT